MLLALVLPNRAGAAISQGPLYTNAVASEQRRVLQFFEAQQSYQEQLKVGRQRYDQRQANRAKIIAAMSEELETRQQTVAIQPAGTSDGHAGGVILESSLWLALAVLSIGIGGTGVYLNRQRALNTSRQ